MKKYRLTNLLTMYKNGMVEKEKLIREISLFVYNYPLKMHKYQEDINSDFFCFFYPKILRIIENFEIRGIPFEKYLIKTINLQLKSFSKRIKERHNSLYIMKNIIFWPSLEREINYFYREDEADKQREPEEIKTIRARVKTSIELTRKGSVKNEIIRKRITMLILKNIFAIRDERFPFLSNLIGKDTKWLEKCRKELKQVTQVKIERKRRLMERRNKHFCRLYIMEQKIIYEVDCEEKEVLKIKINKIKDRISELNRIIRIVGQYPNHKDIADIMGIPKGSVDSGLYYLKLHMENK